MDGNEGWYQVCLLRRKFLIWSYIDAKGISTIRWLYSSCRQCEICEVNHTVCPYQKNAGAVSC